MNKRPGQVRVSTEVAYCSFCNRARTLRKEEHVLGNLVRTIITCETCHRTLSSAMSVAAEEPVQVATPASPPEPEETRPEPAPSQPAAKATASKKPSAKSAGPTPSKSPRGSAGPAPKKPTASKPAVKKTAAAAKPKATAARTAKKK